MSSSSENSMLMHKKETQHDPTSMKKSPPESTTSLSSPTMVQIPSHSSIARNNNSTSDDPSYYDCPAFASEEAYDSYVESISPPRELICPITQELLSDPVVAEDGHTYERTSLLRWFSMGRTRSPVTNSLMTGKNIFPNLAVQGLALAHREKYGKELLNRSRRSHEHPTKRTDNGARILALLDAGADPALRDKDGKTALLFLIHSSQISLARALLDHDAPVNTNNDGGTEYVNSAEAAMHSGREMNNKMEWKEFIDTIRQKAIREQSQKEEKEKARSRANELHREQQRSLAADARARSDTTRAFGTNVRGLGDLEDGWGYFPSLAALQFQSAIPPPSASIAEEEKRKRAQLEIILRSIGGVVFIYFLIC